ncbi:hypothetical protein [Dactylosporangium sp. CS-033363]|uniref:hypothetical protein n=1 Tax=Dactylosporangium sp. CS-033363 TaxID=3239935 RepID=UPI003D920945
MTLATRRLCAGTYLDTHFCQRVLLDAYADRSRYVAPSYGFSLAQVAFHARRAWWLDTAQHVLVTGVLLVALVRSPLALVLAGAVLLHWHAALVLGRLGGMIARYFRERPSWNQFSGDLWLRLRFSLKALVVAWAVLLLSGIAALGFSSVASIWDGNPLAGPIVVTVRQAAADLAMVALVVLLFALARQVLLAHMLGMGEVPKERLNRRMRYMHDQEREPVTYYADFRPFIGSGEELQTWSMDLRLRNRRAPGDDGGFELEADSEVWEDDGQDRIEFTSRKLNRKMREHLERLATDANPEVKLSGLEITERVFAVGSAARDMPAATQEAIEKARTDPTGPARHYLSCRVDSWKGEIVTNVFVHVSLQGRLLYVEFSAWALLPTRPDFHVPDSPGALWRHVHPVAIGRRMGNLPEEIRRLPAALWSVAVFAGRRLPRFWRSGPARSARDPGARFSVREDGAVSRYVAGIAGYTPTDLVPVSHRNVLLIEESDPQSERNALKALREAQRLTRQAARAVNYFQIRDVIRHSRIVERRVLAALNDFLVEEGLDTTEYRARAQQIINASINVFQAPVDARGATFGNSGTSPANAGRT